MSGDVSGPNPTGEGQTRKEAEAPDLRERADAIMEALESSREHGRKGEHRVNIATIVSVVAALFSIGSAVASFVRSEQQDRHAQRQEFSGIVQRIIALQEHQNDEFRVLARLVKDRVPSDATAPEYTVIARALQDTGDIETAKKLNEKAISTAKTGSEKSWSLRQAGWTLMLTGSVVEANDRFFRAAAVAEHDPMMSTDRTYTLINWSQSLALANQCDKAKQERAEALGNGAGQVGLTMTNF